MSTLESKIDELYQQPLDAFTASRNALAKTLTGADAQRIKKLSKPTLVPWALNQLYWHARGSWDRLLKSGERLRAAQLAALAGGRSDVRAATDAHHHALAEAVKETGRLSERTGTRPPADALARALEAISLMNAPPSPAGRLTEAPAPAGFEALAGLAVRPVLNPLTAVPGPAPDHPRSTGKPRTTDPRQAAAARRREHALRKQEAETRKREAAAARKRDAEVARAERTLARARSAMAAAEAKLSSLKSRP